MNKKQFIFDKLVRDKILQMMINHNIEVYYSLLDEEQAIPALKNKLLEEVQEVLLAKDENELNEELADLLEVIQALASLTGGMEEVLQLQKNKYELKGGFDKRIFVEHVILEESSKFADYYRQHPDKYPEVK